MTGNVAFDVVIGLVFVYLLYSLYATIIMEIITSLLGLRSQNLEYALSRLLKDEKYIPNPFKRKLARFATTFSRARGKAWNLEKSELFKKFMNQSAIRYLGSGGLGNKPSYLAPEIFSKALMDSIKIPVEDMSELAAFELGLAALPEPSEVKAHLYSLLVDSKRDPIKFKILVENWFNETMDRSVGWFKQTTQCIVLLIGFVLVFVFNVNTLSIIKKLSTDKAAREQMVKMAADFTERAEKQAPGTTSDKTILDSLMAIQDSLKADILNTQSILSGGWIIPERVVVTAGPTQNLKKDFVNVKVDSGYIVLHKATNANVIKFMVGDKGIDKTKNINRFFYQICHIFFFGNLWGYLLTILALSLGAPFWFDLLNKLVKLRTSKPVESDTTVGQNLNALAKNSKSAILNRVG